MEIEDFVIGETDLLQTFDGRLENRQIVHALCRQAHQQIRIFTPNLENTIYDDAELIRSLSLLTTRSPQTKIKVLVKDSSSTIKSGHRLIELSRRFTSSIHIHKTPVETDNIDCGYIIIDQTAYLYKHAGCLFKGQFNFNDKLKSRELAKQFDEAWERSQADPEMRRLFI